MLDRVQAEHQLEASISHLLRGGVVISALLLVAGWVLNYAGHPAGDRLLEGGIKVLMSTPILRVAATFVLFLRQRDAVYIVVTGIVLALLAVGVVGGIHL